MSLHILAYNLALLAQLIAEVLEAERMFLLEVFGLDFEEIGLLLEKGGGVARHFGIIRGRPGISPNDVSLRGPTSAQIHTSITLGSPHRAKPLVFQLRRRCPCGFDSRRPLHSRLRLLPARSQPQQ